MSQMLDTSLEAYESIKKSLGNRQKKVLELFEKQPVPLCNALISNLLYWPINCVTGRVKELREIGLLVDAGTKKYGKRNVHFWRLLKPKPKQTLFD